MMVLYISLCFVSQCDKIRYFVKSLFVVFLFLISRFSFELGRVAGCFPAVKRSAIRGLRLFYFILHQSQAY